MSTHYTVLARRYRPQTFDEVIGQSHVATSLQNAIRADRVAHAYLFTGARGVGKTSMARILSKALNCPKAVDAVPCNECELCLGISNGNDVDVLEIDGASNRGIDDIRQLRANVSVKSMRTRIKMYIIDEVHMLTKEAFNALLKTLEEPPPNVKFVFCTTEPQKVPETILSRCQRFDFSSIETQTIAHHLAGIAEKEQIEVLPEAIDLVARRAGGSMRDSQSLFDQLLAFGSSPITAEDVNRLLGTASDDRLLEFARNLHAKQTSELFETLNAAVKAGVQLSILVDQLLDLMRDLILCAVGGNSVPLLSVRESLREPMTELAQNWGARNLTAAQQILADTKARLSRIRDGRSLVEVSLVRITMLADLDQLADLSAALLSGKLPEVRIPVASSSTANLEKKKPELVSEPAAQQTEHSAESSVVEAPPATASFQPEESPTEQSPVEAPAAEPEPAIEASHQPESSQPQNEDHPHSPEPAPVVEPIEAEAETKAEAEAVESDAIELTPQSLQGRWPELLESLTTQFRSMVSIAKPVHKPSVGNNPETIELHYDAKYQFAIDRLQSTPEILRTLQSHALQHFTKSVQFKVVKLQGAARQTDDSNNSAPKAVSSQTAMQDEYLQQVIELFGATIGKVSRVPNMTHAQVEQSAGDESYDSDDLD